ncbi:MAG: hypothetical protein JW951_07155, partial [Lentisphaerae bacterium]|nr:hypothetical protein [Lentisphaerota bacterium]
ARRIADPALRRAVSEAWARETRFPLSLSLALRAAFRHKRLYLFKAGSGQTFVTATRPAPLDTAHVVAHLREVLGSLGEHPGSTRKQLVERLRPGADPGSAEGREVLAPLSWLIEKGHIIEFFDGSLSVPLRAAVEKPKRPPRRRRKKRAPKTGAENG